MMKMFNHGESKATKVLLVILPKNYNYFTEFSSCRILEMSREENGSQTGSNPAKKPTEQVKEDSGQKRA